MDHKVSGVSIDTKIEGKKSKNKKSDELGEITDTQDLPKVKKSDKIALSADSQETVASDVSKVEPVFAGEIFPPAEPVISGDFVEDDVPLAKEEVSTVPAKQKVETTVPEPVSYTHLDVYKRQWLYGASGVNCSLFGIGERTGNTPLEAMVFEYAQLKGTLDGMDTTVITELSEYFEKELGYKQPSRTPFVGSNFNVTRAGIHADGLLKNEEIYNIFDTGKFLNRPPLVAVSNTSGLAGIAHWINNYYHLPEDRKVDKNSALVKHVKEWVDAQYDDGRVTVITCLLYTSLRLTI